MQSVEDIILDILELKLKDHKLMVKWKEFFEQQKMNLIIILKEIWKDLE